MGMIKLTVITDNSHIPDAYKIIHSEEITQHGKIVGLRIWVDIPDEKS